MQIFRLFETKVAVIVSGSRVCRCHFELECHRIVRNEHVLEETGRDSASSVFRFDVQLIDVQDISSVLVAPVGNQNRVTNYCLGLFEDDDFTSFSILVSSLNVSEIFLSVTLSVLGSS